MSRYLTDIIPMTPGPAGPIGKTAYQHWLDLGNVGTVGDFILSNKGGKGDPGPGGLRGFPGPGFRPDVYGASINLSDYDSEVEDFCFFSLDESAAYFRITSTPGIWAGPMPLSDPLRIKKVAFRQALILS